MNGPPKSETRNRVNGPGLECAFNRNQCFNPTPDLTQELAEALDRHEDIRALRRWQASLEHRLRIAQLKFLFAGLDAEEQDALAVEIAEFKCIVASLLTEASEREPLLERSAA